MLKKLEYKGLFHTSTSASVRKTTIRKGRVEMEAIAAVPKREPLFVREINYGGSSRIERLSMLRAAILKCLIEEGCLDANGAYGFSHGRRGCIFYCAVKVEATGLEYQAEVGEVGNKVPMNVYVV